MKDLTNIINQITYIQFFPASHTVQTSEDGDSKEVRSYSANIIFNDKLLVQVSGDDDEAHPLSIPAADEQYWCSSDDKREAEKYQDEMAEKLDPKAIEDALEIEGFENNFDYLQEQADDVF